MDLAEAAVTRKNRKSTMPVNGTTSVPMPSARPVILRRPPVGKRRHRRSWVERRIAAKRRCGPSAQCGRPEHGNDCATATPTPGRLATALPNPAHGRERNAAKRRVGGPRQLRIGSGSNERQPRSQPRGTIESCQPSSDTHAAKPDTESGSGPFLRRGARDLAFSGHERRHRDHGCRD